MARRTKTEPIEWRQIEVSNRLVRALTLHALTLEDGHPARACITLVAEKFSQADPIPDEEELEEVAA